MRFLQDFELPPSTHKKKRRPPLTTLPTQSDNTSPRRRLVENDNNKITNDDDEVQQQQSVLEEEEEDATSPTASGQNPHSWIRRMTQALRDWKEQHWQQTQVLMEDQRQQLQAQHEQELLEWKAVQHRPSPGDIRPAATSITRDPSLSTPPSSHRRRTFPRPVSHDRTSTPTQRGGGGRRPHKQSWRSPDGTKTTRYADGTCHESSPNGATLTRFPNGDVQTESALQERQAAPTQSCYYYGSTGALRLNHADGSVVWCFANGQRERHAVDGRVVVDQWAPTA
jgi:hypothetical protein